MVIPYSPAPARIANQIYAQATVPKMIAKCTVESNSIDHAIALMRERAIRRIPVVVGETPVGIVSLGDLAAARDPESALAEISVAPGNL